MSTLTDAARSVRTARLEYEGRAGQARQVLTELKRTQAEVERLQLRSEDLTQVAEFLNRYADERQAVVQGQIEEVVSRGLRTIFGEELVLRLVNRQVGRRPELDFVLASSSAGETLETSILDARGGGVAAVAGFLVQAVMVMLTPAMRPILFLDEVFAQVSTEYEEPLAEFIAELVARTPLQVVLVTHSAAFSASADRQYRFAQTHGVTTVEAL
jgi:DNA repair exonuclease SbcCD ATPase subunit